MALIVAGSFRRRNRLADSRRTVWYIAAVIGLCPCWVIRAEQPYVVRNLDAPVQPTWNYAINDHGDVAGNRFNASAWSAYRIANGQVAMLGTLGGPDSTARNINNLGQVVGHADVTVNRSYGFVWNAGTLINLGGLGPTNPTFWTSDAWDINDAGQIVGEVWLAAGLRTAFLITPENGVWFRDDNADGKNDLMIDLGTFGGVSSIARAIDNAGRIVGYFTTVDLKQHAFLWRNGEMIELGTLGGAESVAIDINNSGQVLVKTFASQDPQALPLLAVITPDGDVWNRDLDFDGANDLMDVVETEYPNPYPVALDDSGRVLGDDGGLPAIWEGGVTHWMYNRFLTDPGWSVGACFDLNSVGDVVCLADHVNAPEAGQIPVVISRANPTVKAVGSRFLEVAVPPGTRSASLRVSTADGSCLLGFVDPGSDPYHRLSASPFAMPCDTWGTINIGGEEIAPGVAYRVQLDLGGGVGASDAVSPRKWGDAIAPFGIVNFQDVSAIVKCFQGSSTAPPMTACDLVPAIPNGIVNFQDVSACVGAFQGEPYPFSFPGPCP